MTCHDQEFRIASMCRVLKVSRSAFYHWRSHQSSFSQRHHENMQLLDDVRRVHETSKRTYGSPRIAAQLRREHKRVNIKRVAKLMRENDIRAKTKKRFKVTTNSTRRRTRRRISCSRSFAPNVSTNSGQAT